MEITMNIVICDDDKLMCSQMKKSVLECFDVLNQEEPVIDIFLSGEELLASDAAYDIAFLDVEMNGISGISAGRVLYERNKHVLIFIVTAYDEYIDEALKFHAFRFFQKPVNPKRLLINLKDAIEVYRKFHEKIVVEMREKSVVVDTKDIIMVEAGTRNTVVYTETEELYSTISMTDITDRLCKYPSFVQTHRGFVVNLNYVSSFGKGYVKVYDGKYIAKLTKRNYPDFKRKFLSLVAT